MATVEERMNAYVGGEAMEPAAPDPASEAGLLSRLEARDAPEESEETEAAAETGEPTETEESEEAEETEESEELPEAAEEDEDAFTVAEIGQLAEHNGIPLEELYEIGVPVTGPDGTRHVVSLGQIKDSYQDQSIAKKAIADAKREAEVYAQKYQQMDEAIHENAARSHAYVQAAQKELTAEFNSVNWQQLQQENPGAYAARRQDFIERNGKLQQMEQAIAQEYRQHKDTLRQQTEAQQQERLTREYRALLDAVPEWQDEKVAAAEKQALSDFLMQSGFRKEEVDAASDHRIIMLARDAMRYRDQLKKADTAKKRVIRIGKKPLKPGSRQSKADQKQDSTRALRSQLRKSGKLEDAVALYQKLGG